MSIKVTIGLVTRDYQQWTEPEINQLLSRHRDDGNNPCVKVKVTTPTTELTLVSKACDGMGGGGALNAEQEALRDLWVKSHMFEDHITGGNLIAFLRKVERIAA